MADCLLDLVLRPGETDPAGRARAGHGGRPGGRPDRRGLPRGGGRRTRCPPRWPAPWPRAWACCPPPAADRAPRSTGRHRRSRTRTTRRRSGGRGWRPGRRARSGRPTRNPPGAAAADVGADRRRAGRRPGVRRCCSASTRRRARIRCRCPGRPSAGSLPDATVRSRRGGPRRMRRWTRRPRPARDCTRRWPAPAARWRPPSGPIWPTPTPGTSRRPPGSRPPRTRSPPSRYATADQRAALADLLERAGGGGLVDRPRIAVTDALTGALLALTDAPGLRAAGTCGDRACRTGRRVCRRTT